MMCSKHGFLSNNPHERYYRSRRRVGKNQMSSDAATSNQHAVQIMKATRQSAGTLAGMKLLTQAECVLEVSQNMCFLRAIATLVMLHRERKGGY